MAIIDNTTNLTFDPATRFLWQDGLAYSIDDSQNGLAYAIDSCAGQAIRESQKDEEIKRLQEQIDWQEEEIRRLKGESDD